MAVFLFGFAAGILVSSLIWAIAYLPFQRGRDAVKMGGIVSARVPDKGGNIDGHPSLGKMNS